MFDLSNFPKSEPARVYYSLGVVSALLTLRTIPPSPEKPLALRGKDVELIKYLWTACMVFGSSKNMSFNHKSINVELTSFDPKPELGWFSRFSTNSLYNNVFVPVLGKTVVEFNENEINLDFGHQVPNEQSALKNEVRLLLSKAFYNHHMYISNIIVKTSEFRNGLEAAKFGAVKIASAVTHIPAEVVKFNFGEIYPSFLGAPGLIKILNALPQKLKVFLLLYTRSFSNWVAMA